MAEGVEVTTGRTGEMRVDFAQWGWFPEPRSHGISTQGREVVNEVQEGQEEDAS